MMAGREKGEVEREDGGEAGRGRGEGQEIRDEDGRCRRTEDGGRDGSGRARKQERKRERKEGDALSK
jgi:hypothetical protein